MAQNKVIMYLSRNTSNNITALDYFLRNWFLYYFDYFFKVLFYRNVLLFFVFDYFIRCWSYNHFLKVFFYCSIILFFETLYGIARNNFVTFKQWYIVDYGLISFQLLFDIIMFCEDFIARASKLLLSDTNNFWKFVSI